MQTYLVLIKRSKFVDILRKATCGVVEMGQLGLLKHDMCSDLEVRLLVLLSKIAGCVAGLPSLKVTNYHI